MGGFRASISHSKRIASSCSRASTSRGTRLLSTNSPAYQQQRAAGIFEEKNVKEKAAEKPPWDWQRMVRARERRGAVRELCILGPFDSFLNISKLTISQILALINAEKTHISRIMA